MTEPTSSPGSDTDSQLSAIAFYRLGGGPDYARRYDLDIDGEQVGRVRRNETVTVEVRPGAHHVQARVGGGFSDKIQVDVAPGSTLRVQVAPSSASAMQKLTNGPWILIAPDEPGRDEMQTMRPPERGHYRSRRISGTSLGIGLVAVGISAVEHHWLAAGLLLVLVILGSAVRLLTTSARTPRV